MEGYDGVPAAGVLIVEDDPEHARRMRQALSAGAGGVRVTAVDRLRSALEAVRDEAIGCAVTGLDLPDAEGVAIVRALRTARRALPVIVVAERASAEVAVAAMKMGAADYLAKDERWAERLPCLVREALGRSVLAGLPAEGAEAAEVRGADHAMIATTAGMRRVLGLVERAAGSAVPVLIEGETGTGKELLARAIHRLGPRRDAPFLVQNCAALAEPLLESELFGHVRGAYTGAERDRRGLFDEAGDGTVFLDEIAEAPPALQAKLLRVLQHGEVKPVGADRVRRVRARVVAASNRSLEAEARAGCFRTDLFYRLAVFPIAVPPLRRRMADVVPLVAYFLHRHEEREGRRTGGFDADALRALHAYPWPGNVRELENEVHRLVLAARQDERVRRHHLARRIQEAEPLAPDESLQRILRRVETALIRQRLERTASKSAAARSLGITREALYAKMRRLGMPTRTG